MAASGCDADPQVGMARSAEDPCELVPTPELEAAVGFPVEDPYNPVERGAPPPVDMVGMEFCTFVTANEPRRPSLVTLGLATAYAGVVFANHKEANPERVSHVDGLGTEAVWDEGAQVVIVLLGDRVVALKLTFGQSGVHHQKARTIRLMTLALDQS
jgi:hypothetical protein